MLLFFRVYVFVLLSWWSFSSSSVAAAKMTGSKREIVNFDFSWRHRLGVDPKKICASSPPEEGRNYGTGGIRFPNASSPEVCCSKCAEQSWCRCWDFNTENHDCWVKSSGCDTFVENEERVSARIPSPPAHPKECDPDFDDSTWDVVDAPHDMLIVQPFDPTANNKQAFIPRNVGWYRKHFHLPTEYANSSVWIYVEAAFHVADAWLNGVQIAPTHKQGYTGFRLRLDNISSVKYGEEKTNVLAIFVNASTGTGWWYEGGGLIRHNWLVSAAPLHVAYDGAWIRVENISGGVDNGGGSFVASSAYFVASVTIANDRGYAFENVTTRVDIVDASDQIVASGSSEAVSIGSRGEVTLSDVGIFVKDVNLWSVQTPYLYSARIGIYDNVESATVPVDEVVIANVGARSVIFNPDSGMFLNGKHVKLRGMCDHENFGGIGAAIADRINLFRAQKLRSVGINSWRMAHGAPPPTRLEFMDRLGMLAIDENRDYGGRVGQGGPTDETISDELSDMADLVKRDRNHPSVVLWSTYLLSLFRFRPLFRRKTH